MVLESTERLAHDGHIKKELKAYQRNTLPGPVQCLIMRPSGANDFGDYRGHDNFFGGTSRRPGRYENISEETGNEANEVRCYGQQVFLCARNLKKSLIGKMDA